MFGNDELFIMNVSELSAVKNDVHSFSCWSTASNALHKVEHVGVKQVSMCCCKVVLNINTLLIDGVEKILIPDHPRF